MDLHHGNRGIALAMILVSVCDGTCKDRLANVKGGVHKDYKVKNKGMKADVQPRYLRMTMLPPWEALHTYHRDPSP